MLCILSSSLRAAKWSPWLVGRLALDNGRFGAYPIAVCFWCRAAARRASRGSCGVAVFPSWWLVSVCYVQGVCSSLLMCNIADIIRYSTIPARGEKWTDMDPDVRNPHDWTFFWPRPNESRRNERCRAARCLLYRWRLCLARKTYLLPCCARSLTRRTAVHRGGARECQKRLPASL